MPGFDQKAADWDSDPKKVERARVVAEAIIASLPTKRLTSMLEYGCGTGLLSFALQPWFTTITLADTSQGMLDVLEGKIKNAGVENMQPIRLDLESEPVPDQRFDIIVSLMTLHHLRETAAVLRSFNTLLNPGGFLCISDLEKEDGTFHGMSVMDVHRGFERASLEEMFLSAGFQPINWLPVYIVKKTVEGSEKSFPLFLAVSEKSA